MIPAEAVEAAADIIVQGDRGACECRRSMFDKHDVNPPCSTRRNALRVARLALEAAAPHMLIHVHHHDIEKHAESFNEGYETCMAQELADDPTTAQDWLDEKLRAAKEEAWSHGHHDGAVDQMLHMENGGAKTTPNPYMLNTEGKK